MKMTEVWGSSGAGKTITALALGAAFAKQRKDTLILSTDTCTPALPLYLPRRTDLKSNNSIGGMLEEEHVTEASLKDRIHRHPKSERLFFMGYVSGETPTTYKQPDESTFLRFFQMLEHSPFQHVIVDCVSNPIYDVLTLFSLEAADAVVRVTTPDIKGYEFLKAQLAWMENSESFRAGQHIKLENLVLPLTPQKEAAALFGGFDFSLKYTRQAAERMMAGELLSGFDDVAAMEYEHTVDAIAARIQEVSEDEAG